MSKVASESVTDTMVIAINLQNGVEDILETDEEK
jgi:hypothetical protein